MTSVKIIREMDDLRWGINTSKHQNNKTHQHKAELQVRIRNPS